MTKPWSSFQFKSGAIAKNRFVLAPMTTDASNPDGTVTPEELAYARRRGASAFGTAISSCAYVHDDGRSWNGIGAAHADHVCSLARLAREFQVAGAIAILQLYDGGRIARASLVGDDRLRAPSAIASLRPGALTPREMTAEEVEHLIEDFRAAARRAQQAGFDGIELHGANHYLMHQFFSPRANQRQDRWGGDLEKRMRFPLEVTRAVRDGVGPTMVVGYRLTPFEAEPDGYGLDDAMVLADRLADLPIDYLHISLDDFRSGSPQREDRSYTVKSEPPVDSRNPIAAITQVVGGRCAVIACGGIRTEADASLALAAGADLVAVGRAALIDPDWLPKLQAGDEAAIATLLPHAASDIARQRTIPPRMVDYLLSRPGWIPRR
jgi:2,4-dienoyl-CoA reductase-like NADH-dependent reductase (Old Yellow Enzyme family)